MGQLPAILMVEDDPDQAKLFTQLLTLSGYQVDTMPDAGTALARIAETVPDLILVDWDLPEIKGDAFISETKRRYPDVRSILFSNHTHVDEAARACGADGWFRKSDDIFHLREIIKGLVG
ncbi:MAG TPA: response regulator [Armatimonadota bacterium]